MNQQECPNHPYMFHEWLRSMNDRSFAAFLHRAAGNLLIHDSATGWGGGREKHFCNRLILSSAFCIKLEGMGRPDPPACMLQVLRIAALLKKNVNHLAKRR